MFFIGIASAYLSVLLSNEFALEFGYISLIWPVAGIMFALYLIYGPWLLVANVIGMSLALYYTDVLSQLPLQLNMVLALFTSAQLYLSKRLILSFCTLPVQTHLPLDIVKFLILAGPISSAINALFSILLLLPYLPYSTSTLLYIALAIWIANLISIVFLTPIFLFLVDNPLVKKAKRPYVAIAATAIVLIAVFSVYILVNRGYQERQRSVFINAGKEFIEATDKLLHSIKHNLTAIDGLIQSSHYISKQEFERFATEMLNLHQHNIIRAFAWLPRVSAPQRAAFEQYLQQAGELHTKIRQLTPSGIVTAKAQAFYLPIKYSFPYQQNKSAIGLDVSTHPIAADAVQKAINSQSFALSPLLSLVQQQDKFTAAIVYYPSINHSSDQYPLTGVTEAVLELDNLFAALHQSTQHSLYTFTLSYGDNNRYQHPSFNPNAKFIHSVKLELFDQKATLQLASTPAFEQTLVNWLGLGILLIGCIIGVICVMFVFFIVTFNATLARQVSNSTRQLTIQNQQLAQANEAKNLFLANISHEYRTPLNAIIGFTDIAQNEITDPPSLAYFAQINDSSKILLGIVNDVLDYSKIQAGELKLESRAFNLRQTIETVSNMFLAQAQQKGIILSLELDQGFDSWVSSDQVRFKQILINLVNNAVKFTSSGKVVIKGQSQDIAEAKKQFEIKVQDSGIGIAKQDLAALFKPFSQAERSTSRRFGGTGLGLSIVQQLCQLMAGKVEVNSELGQGSEFTITLDFNLVAAPEQTIEAATEQMNLSHCRILVAEDNKVNQVLISKHLDKLKAYYHIANNGQEAIDKVTQEPFDLILMDLQMPVMDGLDAAKTIKQTPELQHIPIIILSASVGQYEKAKASALGIYDYVEKPFKQWQLLKALQKHLV